MKNIFKLGRDPQAYILAYEFLLRTRAWRRQNLPKPGAVLYTQRMSNVYIQWSLLIVTTILRMMLYSHYSDLTDEKTKHLKV